MLCLSRLKSKGQLTSLALCKLMAQVPCYSNRKETVYPSCVTILQEACQGDTGGGGVNVGGGLPPLPILSISVSDEVGTRLVSCWIYLSLQLPVQKEGPPAALCVSEC